MPRSHPPGTVGILSGDQTRWAWFAQSVLALQAELPPGSIVLWCQGLWISAAVNTLVRAMQGEWLCIMADDHKFAPDLVTRMLEHELPVVAPLCCLRRYPFQPSLFYEDAHQHYQGYTWPELAGKSGLMPVDAMGGPGMVVRREALDALGDPWYENHPMHREAPHEDLYFFSKLRRAGFQPYVDLDTPIGHILPVSVVPTPGQDGRWGIEVWSSQTLTYLHP
jgi:hypothetical protein